MFFAKAGLLALLAAATTGRPQNVNSENSASTDAAAYAYTGPLYVPADKNVYVYDPANPNKVWNYPLDTFYVPADPAVYKYDPANPNAEWTYKGYTYQPNAAGY